VKLICIIIGGHKWGSWVPRHGRFRFRERECTRCPARQVHDVITGKIHDKKELQS
jgi:hypothetical protein